MTAEYLTAIGVILGVVIAFRTTSHTELRSLYDSLRSDFNDYKKAAEKREADADCRIDTLNAQVIKYERYINRLVAQLERAQIVPEKMDP